MQAMPHRLSDLRPARCPVCHKTAQVLPDGTLGPHLKVEHHPGRDYGRKPWCAGGGQQVLEPLGNEGTGIKGGQQA